MPSFQSRTRRQLARLGTLVRNPRHVLARGGRSLRRHRPNVVHAGWRSTVRVRPAGHYQKTFTASTAAQEAMACEIHAREIFAASDWIVPIETVSGRTLTLPLLRAESRL